MNHIGLFEGIGGFSLAVRWMGWNTVAWCEWNEFCQKILKYHFPEADQNSDITKTCFKKYANRIDILTGGFPCQPYSVAGQRKGKDDERHLWPEMLRAIKEIQPRWVVGENVFGLVNWSGGLVFHEVQTDLEAAGYEVFPYVLPACATNAPHRRDRVWFIAYRASEAGFTGTGQNTYKRKRQDGFQKREGRNIRGGLVTTGTPWHVANTTSVRFKRYAGKRQTGIQRRGGGPTRYKPCRTGRKGSFTYSTSIGMERRWAIRKQITGTHVGKGLPMCGSTANDWSKWPTQPPVCSGNDGLPSGLDGITFSNWRKESIKAYGNAIVPQVAFEIFKAIEAYEQLKV